MNILANNCCSTTTTTNNVISFSGSQEDKNEMYFACIRSYIPYLSPSQIKNLFINGIEIEERCEKQFCWNKQSIMEFGNLINQDIYSELCDISKLIFISSSLDGNAYIWKKENKMYVAFRGTSSRMDILIDLDFTMFHWKEDIFVHSGFIDQFLSLNLNISMEITKDIEEIHFCGHSLGAGLATLASAYYAEKHPNIKVICMTFGSPKVGNDGFVKWFEKNITKSIRMCNCGDPVTMLPFWYGWNHVKNTWYINGVALSDKKSLQIIKKSKHDLTNYINALL